MNGQETTERPERIFLSPPHMGGSELDHIHAAFEANYIAPVGPQLTAFEQEFAAKVGAGGALALSSGTAALHLALRVLGVGPEDVVLVSTLTFIASVSPVVYCGAEPVFIDADPNTWCMDPGLLAGELANLQRQGKRPKAVIPVDLYGQPVDLESIRAICEPMSVPIVCDCAESLGSLYKERPIGQGAWASCYSFNGNKIITTGGGGMLVSDDQDLIDQAHFLSTQARDQAAHYQHSAIGYNYRMSNIAASIGLGQLAVLDERVERKREIFGYYRQALGDMEGLAFMPEAEHARANRWLTVILLDPKRFGAQPEEVRLALEKHNIESRPVWKPMHLQPVFAGRRVVGGGVAEELFARGLCLPSGTALGQADLERIVDIVRGCAG